MNVLVILAIILIAIWLLALVVFKIAGFALHLLLIIGIVMLVWGVIKRTTGAVRGPRV